MNLKLMAILAHPDDESLGMGGTLAKYAAEGVDVALLTATRGERGRFHGHRAEEEEHPGAAALAGIREQELRAAVSVLGVRRVSLLDYPDQQLACANPHEAIASIACELRRSRPDVVVTFGPDGAYGHPDHIAISQFTTAATMVAADPAFVCHGGRGRAAALGLEALLPGVDGGDLRRVSGRRRAAVVHGGRSRAPGQPLARLGGHDGDRHAPRVEHGVAGRQLPPVTTRRLRAAERPPDVSARSVVGEPVVLSGLQHRQRREGPGD